MAQMITVNCYGQNGNSFASVKAIGFPVANVVFQEIPPTDYAGTECITAIKVLPTAPSPIQPEFYTDQAVADLVDAANAA